MKVEITEQKNSKEESIKDSFLLEYELTQLKIDNYGKSIIQIRAMALAITGIFITFFYQKTIIESILILLVIQLVLLFIENEHYIHQGRLTKHILELERISNKVKRFRFSLAKLLSKKIEKGERFEKKRLRRSWLLITLISVSLIIILIHFLYNKKINTIKNNSIKVLTIKDIDEKLSNISIKLKNIETNKNELLIEIDNLTIFEKKLSNSILNLQKEKQLLQKVYQEDLDKISKIKEQIKNLEKKETSLGEKNE